jgi:hypothetical protein
MLRIKHDETTASVVAVSVRVQTHACCHAASIDVSVGVHAVESILVIHLKRSVLLPHCSAAVQCGSDFHTHSVVDVAQLAQLWQGNPVQLVVAALHIVHGTLGHYQSSCERFAFVTPLLQAVIQIRIERVNVVGREEMVKLDCRVGSQRRAAEMLLVEGGEKEEEVGEERQAH